MLILHCKNLDICRASRILVKCSLRATITEQTITLDGDITDKVLGELLTQVDVDVIQNFNKETINITTVDDESSVCVEAEKNVKDCDKNIGIVTNIKDSLDIYDLIYSEVNSGEIYLCDFGPVCGKEIAGLRPAIVVQDINKKTSRTIVIPCTTKERKKNPNTTYRFKCSNQNALDYDKNYFNGKTTIVLLEEIRAVDKRRLRRYLGSLKPNIMQNLHAIIKESMGLSRDNIMRKEKPIKRQANEKRDINITQIKLLSNVDLSELLTIKNSSLDALEKVNKIIATFGFDLERKGTKYLIKAIIAAPKETYYNLETLVDLVSRSEEIIDKEKVKKSMVAVVKETFNMKKVPAIDFIRLVNIFLDKWEEEHND